MKTREALKRAPRGALPKLVFADRGNGRMKSLTQDLGRNRRLFKADPWGGLLRAATTVTEASTLVASGAAEGG